MIWSAFQMLHYHGQCACCLLQLPSSYYFTQQSKKGTATSTMRSSLGARIILPHTRLRGGAEDRTVNDRLAKLDEFKNTLQPPLVLQQIIITHFHKQSTDSVSMTYRAISIVRFKHCKDWKKEKWVYAVDKGQYVPYFPNKN